MPHCWKSHVAVYIHLQPQYLRIQEVAKEQMETYEKYARELEEKIRRQRDEIQRKAQQFLQRMADQERQVLISLYHMTSRLGVK